ncbi:murein biosynthesis integral membrane protein MurJ [Halodesulfovibrio sp.]|jgi:putative peptidoglycan lipid II flippase|uniref:murein biosynthesis integral membrane protein MurJ n=1 Tax=Halodesulfovibrio sp. TaxID=1912772 RepID=UPI0025DE9ED8|nr:murein biosynthesis integral membrane protein MurJ [Halodesulfovibrio sp.]MCT4536188.1 murein biosynthesis integral membrane protein MurJ [Halodesulfovibrio sp.]
MAFLTGRQHMGVAAVIMAVSIFLSRFMGLIRDKVISFYYGASIESDIYFASFVIPDFLNYLLAGGYFSITLIPLLAEYFGKDEKDGWSFLSSVLFWVGVVATAGTCVAWLSAPYLAKIAAPGFDAASLTRLTYFLRIILPAQIFFLLGSCLSGVLYMRKQFLVPALVPLVYNASIIVGGLLMIDKGMEGFCWGVLFGAVSGSFMLPYIAVRSGGLQWRFTLNHRGLKKFVLLALPLMIGQSIVVLDEQFVRIFGSLTGDGAVSLLNYSRRIMLVPVGVVAQAAGVASYPFLAALVAKGDTDEFNATLSRALRNTMLFIVPLSFWMISAAEPTLRLIFQQGSFGAQETLGATPLLQIMLASVAFWGVQQMIGRAFYAHKDTITPAVVGSIVSLLAVPVYWYLGKTIGVMGVALAGTMSVIIYTVALSTVWRHRFGGDAFKGVVRMFLLSAVLCVPAMAASIFTVQQIPLLLKDQPLTGAFASLAVSGTLFCALYACTSWLLAPKAIEPVIAFVRGRILRRA